MHNYYLKDYFSCWRFTFYLYYCFQVSLYLKFGLKNWCSLCISLSVLWCNIWLIFIFFFSFNVFLIYTSKILLNFSLKLSVKLSLNWIILDTIILRTLTLLSIKTVVSDFSTLFWTFCCCFLLNNSVNFQHFSLVEYGIIQQWLTLNHRES